MKLFGTCLLVLGVSIGKGLHMSVSSNSSVSSKEGPLCKGGTNSPPQETDAVMAKGREFVPVLNALPRRTLNRKELDAFKRDGVVVLRNVIPDRDLLRRLKDSVEREGFPDDDRNVQPWDSAEVALGLESTLFADLAASAYEVPGPICVSLSGIFSTAPSPDRLERRFTPFHVDKREPTDQQVAIWLALTDAKDPLDYLRGSNHFRAEIYAACWKLRPGMPNLNEFKMGCGDQYEANLTRYLGYPSLWSTEVKAGDVLIHDGNVAHRGLPGAAYRLALAFRYNFPDGAKHRTDFDQVF